MSRTWTCSECAKTFKLSEKRVLEHYAEDHQEYVDIINEYQTADGEWKQV